MNEEKAKAHLLAGAFFFAMKSCKYSKSGGNIKRRTITVRVKDVCFRMGKKWLLNGSPSLHIADLLSISFHLQKQEKERGETVTMYRARDCQLNP
eukprot:5690476-Ditylum_brightwellii.AAC.1